MATQEEIQAVIDDRYQAIAEIERKGSMGLLTLHGLRRGSSSSLAGEVEWLHSVKPGGPETVNELFWRGRPKFGARMLTVADLRKPIEKTPLLTRILRGLGLGKQAEKPKRTGMATRL